LRLRDCAARSPEIAALDITDLYRDALEFKFTPDRAPQFPGDQVQALRRISEKWWSVFHFIEAKRHGSCIGNLPRDYAAWAGIRESAQNGPAQWPRNLIHNLKAKQISWSYPRERLYRKLPILLFDGFDGPDWVGQSAAYLEEWRKFN